MQLHWKPFLLTGACSLLILACGGGGEDAGPSATAKARGEEIFSQTCWTCHGKTGIGDGPAAAALDPKPRNYTDAAWQDSVTDQQIKDIIVKGGEATGLNATMPAHPQLAGDADALDGLVYKIRSFRK